MKRKLVFATNNAHKLEEVAAILGDQIELLSLNDIGCHTDIPAMQAAKDTTPKPICSNCFTNWKAKKIAKHNSVLPFR